MHMGPQVAARIRRESELRVVRLIWVGGQCSAARMEIILRALFDCAGRSLEIRSKAELCPKAGPTMRSLKEAVTWPEW